MDEPIDRTAQSFFQVYFRVIPKCFTRFSDIGLRMPYISGPWITMGGLYI
jgi:hypothetical protein